MSLSKKLDELVTRAGTGEMPKGREDVADCAIVVLNLLVGEMLAGQSVLGKELGYLVERLSNQADPMLAELSIGTKTFIFPLVNNLKHLRRLAQHGQAKQTDSKAAGT